MNPVIHFVAGTPRSGSTLLMNILGQNPRHFVTPTNGLLDSISFIRDNWVNNDTWVAQGLEKVRPRIPNLLRAMVYGYYQDELGTGKVVFDKHRGWTAQIELLEAMFDRPVKVICPIRDVRAIAASFEKLYRADPISRRFGSRGGPDMYRQAQTIDGRARLMLQNGDVGLSVSWIRDVFNKGLGDRLVLIPYRELTTKPEVALNYLHQQLGLPPFEYDFENVEQLTVEDDILYGWGPNLHRIRSRVEPQNGVPWEGVLSPETVKWVGEEFKDINRLASFQLESPGSRQEVACR